MKLSTDQKITLLGLFIGALGVIGTFLTVPEVRSFLAGLSGQKENVQATPVPTRAGLETQIPTAMLIPPIPTATVIPPTLTPKRRLGGIGLSARR